MVRAFGALNGGGGAVVGVLKRAGRNHRVYLFDDTKRQKQAEHKKTRNTTKKTDRQTGREDPRTCTCTTSAVKNKTYMYVNDNKYNGGVLGIMLRRRRMTCTRQPRCVHSAQNARAESVCVSSISGAEASVESYAIG